MDVLKGIYLLSLLVCFNSLIGSEQRDRYGRIIQVAEINRGDVNNSRVNDVPSGRSSVVRCYDQSRLDSISSDCKQCCCSKPMLCFCVIAGLGFGLGFGLEPHYYRVYNREPYTLDVRYRPGCTVKSGKRRVPVDCHRFVSSGKRTKIFSSGTLTKLCAAKFGNVKQECATQDGLKSDFNWYVHDGLKFSRGKGGQNQAPTNSTDDLESFGVSFTDAEFKGMRESVNVVERSSTKYLRGIGN